MEKRKLKKFLYWLQVSLVSLVLLGSLFGKLVKAEGQLKNAENWNIPYELLYVIGLAELLIVVLLIMRKVRLGAGLLIVLMVGAIGTHLTHNEAQFVILNIALIGLTVGIFVSGRVFNRTTSHE